jgi:DNA-binding NtrC family response regulator
VQQWEKGYVEAALLITQGNLSQAAKLLGIHRTTLYSRMQNYGDGASAEPRANSE